MRTLAITIATGPSDILLRRASELAMPWRVGYFCLQRWFTCCPMRRRPPSHFEFLGPCAPCQHPRSHAFRADCGRPSELYPWIFTKFSIRRQTPGQLICESVNTLLHTCTASEFSCRRVSCEILPLPALAEYSFAISGGGLPTLVRFGGLGLPWFDDHGGFRWLKARH